MNRFIGNDASLDAKISKAIEETYRLTASRSRDFYGKGIQWESTFSGVGLPIRTPYEKGVKDGRIYMACRTSRWGGAHIIK